MIERRIRRSFEVTNIEMATKPKIQPGRSIRVTLDADSRGMTNREYIQRSIEHTIGGLIASFDYAEIKEAEEAAAA